MVKLFFSPGACSLAAHIVLEELGLSYQTINVDLKTHTTEAGDYYKINPQGAVPVLQLEDGSLLTQNLAVLIYLGDLDTHYRLIPKPATLERSRCYEWLGFCNSDLHKSFGPLFRPAYFVDSEKAQAELISHARDNISKLMNMVDKKLPTNTYTLGKNFSVVDAYLFVFYRWLRGLKFSPKHWPNYAALAERISERPAVQRVLLAEGLIKPEQ
jgi:glutathione S-transferase